jgi:predicted acetyltransferase
MLGLGLGKCRALGLGLVTLACLEANAASAAVILRHGGVPDRAFTHSDGRAGRIYRIVLDRG